MNNDLNELSCLSALSGSLSTTIKRANGYKTTKKIDYYLRQIRKIKFQIDSEDWEALKKKTEQEDFIW